MALTFAQALARIEELMEIWLASENLKAQAAARSTIQDLMLTHADSIVQLGKVSAEMRGAVDDDTCRVDPNDWLLASRAYDKLLNGEGSI